MTFYCPDDPRSLEKYSSAITLSDMEIFIFPELMYALVLADIMSPRIWRWREDRWFRKLPKMNDYKRVQRTKQYIMDHFTFNLDLETWGLTTKEQELARFRGFVDEEVLARSNALFGYEGDKYYFDIDIRRHFGLDKYTSEVIPYWKTETVEAMEAFRHRPDHDRGAGECVSLAALYAAAMFVVAGLPLDTINLLATPLHSQNFLAVRDGILTNNRRIVTRAMWFNGTELSAKARRALENERVTIIANNHGHVHTVFPETTMPADVFADVAGRLRNYLQTPITFGVLASFLRQRRELQECFQLRRRSCGRTQYIEAEKAFGYEHSHKARIGEESQDALLAEIDGDEFYPRPLDGRIVMHELEEFFRDTEVETGSREAVAELRERLAHGCYDVEEVVRGLIAFARTEPRLPDHAAKTPVPVPSIELDARMAREEMIERLADLRTRNPVADLAFFAYRDPSLSAWKPLLKAALERNPVAIEESAELDAAALAARLHGMCNCSIYDGGRLAQPDEVWNFGRGDGLEKALCLYAVLRARDPDQPPVFVGDRDEAVVRHAGAEYRFRSDKDLEPPTDEDFAAV